MTVKRINVNAQNRNGDTPLHVAAEKNNPNVIAALLEYPNVNPNLQNNVGKTALHVAARFNASAAIKALLKHKATDPHASSDVAGETALHTAANYNNLAAIETLCTHPGINRDAQTHFEEETPLHTAIKKNHDEAAAMLLKYGASHTIKTKYGANAHDIADITGDKLQTAPAGDRAKNVKIKLALKPFKKSF